MRRKLRGSDETSGKAIKIHPDMLPSALCTVCPPPLRRSALEVLRAYFWPDLAFVRLGSLARFARWLATSYDGSEERKPAEVSTDEAE